MVTMQMEIPKEDYIRLSKMQYKAICDYVEDVAADSGYHPYGYGCYTPRLLEIGKGYFATWERAYSCD